MLKRARHRPALPMIVRLRLLLLLLLLQLLLLLLLLLLLILIIMILIMLKRARHGPAPPLRHLAPRLLISGGITCLTLFV